MFQIITYFGLKHCMFAGSRRGIGVNEERDQTLNQLLTELDGFEGREGVLLLAATNRAEVSTLTATHNQSCIYCFTFCVCKIQVCCLVKTLQKGNETTV